MKGIPCPQIEVYMYTIKYTLQLLAFSGQIQQDGKLFPGKIKKKKHLYFYPAC